MTAERIATMVAAGGSETLAFKSTTGTRREAAQTVCAMLNRQGGQVLFGVAPDGRMTGQQVGERTVEERLVAGQNPPDWLRHRPRVTRGQRDRQQWLELFSHSRSPNPAGRFLAPGSDRRAP